MPSSRPSPKTHTKKREIQIIKEKKTKLTQINILKRILLMTKTQNKSFTHMAVEDPIAEAEVADVAAAILGEVESSGETTDEEIEEKGGERENIRSKKTIKRKTI